MVINFKNTIDMKSLIYQSGTKLVLLFAAILLITACEKNEEETLPAPRLFKASDIKVEAGQTSAKIKWGVPLLSTGKALTYTVDFSTSPAFTTIAYTKVVDTAGITVTEDNIALRTTYYARVKANAFGDQPESKSITSSSFSLTGIQLFAPVRDTELRENSVTLRFANDATITSIKLTPENGTAITIPITTADLTAAGANATPPGKKDITGLTGGVKYTAQLLGGTKDKGILTFTTLAVTNYTLKISPTDDLAATITAAANGAVIGLNPGTYNVTALNTYITGKTITLKSTSGNPADTKVNFKEIDLEGTGAGVTLSGIEFDGTTAAAAYFLNFIGTQAANGAAATFTNVVVDNCIVHGTTTSFLRANRGTAVKDHKITGITVSNSVVYDMGANSSAAYYTFHLDKLEFKTLTVSKSTFYNSGAGLITANTLIGSDIPVITVSYNTINGFGGAAKYAVLDANTNPVNATIQNNIIANTPRSATVAAAAIRSSGTGSTVVFTYNNTFGLFTAVGGTTAVTIPASLTNQTVDLGWNFATVNFTLPVGSSLRTSSSNSTALGDPRWTY